MPIKCCRGCIAPKRYPGCHSHCPEYIKERAEYDEQKAIEDEKKRTDDAIFFQRQAAVAKAMRNRKSFFGHKQRRKISDG